MTPNDSLQHSDLSGTSSKGTLHTKGVVDEDFFLKVQVMKNPDGG